LFRSPPSASGSRVGIVEALKGQSPSSYGLGVGSNPYRKDAPMQGSHAILTESSLSPLEQLSQFLAQHQAASEPHEDFEAFERELTELFARAQSEVTGAELARHDVDVPVVLVRGVAHRRVLRCKSTYVTASGEVEVTRTLYRKGEEATICPMDLRAGIVEDRFTPRAARQAVWAMAHMTSRECEDLFVQVGGMRPSRCTLDRLSRDVGAQWERDRPIIEPVLRATEEIPSEAVAVGVSLDGVLVPMLDGQRARKRGEARAEGRPTKGPAGYQEAGCGTLSFYDKEGHRLGTRKLGRMPETGKKTLKAWLRDELTSVLTERPELTVVKLADGARDNWTFLAEELPDGVECVDFFHVAEHLSQACHLAYGENSTQAQAYFEKWRHILREDPRGVDKVIRALTYQCERRPRSKKLRIELGYFRRNRNRMPYAALKKQKLPIGSGVVEAACKTLATQRLKRSGMRWRHAGGQAVLSFRSLLQSDRFDRAWPLLATAYKKTVEVPHNVVPLRRKNVRN